MNIGITAIQYKNAFNLHFSDKVDYDFFTYNGKTKQNQDTLNKSKFRWQYIGLEKKVGSELLYLYYKIWKKNNFGFINDKQLFKDARQYTLDPKSLDREKFIETTFVSDLQYLKRKYNGSTELFRTSPNELYPSLFKEYDKQDISLETFLILCAYIKNVLNNDCSEDVIRWPKEVQRMNKIIPFIIRFFDRDICEQLFLTNYLS